MGETPCKLEPYLATMSRALLPSAVSVGRGVHLRGVKESRDYAPQFNCYPRRASGRRP